MPPHRVIRAVCHPQILLERQAYIFYGSVRIVPFSAEINIISIFLPQEIPETVQRTWRQVGSESNIRQPELCIVTADKVRSDHGF